jgi:hypothetical protein
MVFSGWKSIMILPSISWNSIDNEQSSPAGNTKLRIEEKSPRTSGYTRGGISGHVYETFLRYVLRYVLRYNFGKKLGTSYGERKTRLGMCLYDIYRISKLRCPNYFRTFLFYGVSWIRKASRNRLKTKMCPKIYLGHVLVLR